MPCLALPEPSQEPSATHQGMKPTTAIQFLRLPGAAFKQRGIAAFGCLGLLMGCEGRAFWHATRLKMLSEGSKGREGEGSEKLDREYTWGNREI